MTIRSALVATTFLFVPFAAQAAGTSPLSPFVLTSASYTQNFDTLASTGTSNILPAGFQIAELGTGAAADGSYAAGTGSSNSSNAYSFGATGATDRALGSLASGSVSPIYLGGIFTNGLAATITSLRFAFTGEQWRAGSSSDDKLAFEFLVGATSVEAGTWTPFTALDFVPLVLSGDVALNGNANSGSINGTLSGLTIAAGSRFGFRWVDSNSSGNDHGLAIDNLSINATVATAGAVPEPGTWALVLAGFGIVGYSLRRSSHRSVSIT